MNHEESNMQQACVSWFRAQYPQYAMLLIHPINEGSGHTTKDRRRQGIHKAEGAVAGVSDLIFFMPVYNASLGLDEEYREDFGMSHGLCIEFKTPKGKQSQEQKDFETMMKAAGYQYEIIRSFEAFRQLMTAWISLARKNDRQRIASAHVTIVKEAEEREKKRFYKILGKEI